jgi:ABC-type dipeptide/oligopeptide/nickel transport system permease component
MSSVTVPAGSAVRPQRSAPDWLLSTQMWAGVSIAAMWLAVLFVGIFGGDIVSTGATSASTVPVVAAVAPFAFLATILVAYWGFGVRRRAVDELRTGLEAERRAREQLAAEVAELRARPGS